MEEKTVVIPATPTEPTTVTNPDTPTGKERKSDKLLTQSEVDNIIRERLNKQKEQIFKNLGFESVDKAKETFTSYEKLKAEHETVKTELETFRQEKTKRELTQKVQELGVDKDFTEFVLSNVKNDENFEANVKTFLQANPKIKADNFIQQSSNPSLNKGGQVDISKMSQKEYNEWRNKNPKF